MSLIDFRAARLLAAQPRLLFQWAQIGTREHLQQQFNKDSLEVRRQQIEKLYEFFFNELVRNLKNLSQPSGDRAARYLKEVEGIFIQEQKHQQKLLSRIERLLLKIDLERHSSRQGMGRHTIAWLKIQNGLKPTLHPLSIDERNALGCLYTISVGAVGHMEVGMNEVMRQYRVLGHYPPVGLDCKVEPVRVQSEEPANQEGMIIPETWEGVLLDGLTVPILKNLLMRTVPPLLEDNEKPTDEGKPRMWAAAIAALRKANKVDRDNTALLHRHLFGAFGKVVSLTQLRSGYIEQNSEAKRTYESITELVKFL